MENRKSDYLKLFLSYQDDFFAYLYSLTGNRDACLDIFQNAAVTIMENDELENIRNFRAWSKELVRRQALYFLRSEAQRKVSCRSLEPELLDAISDLFVSDPSESSIVGDESESLSKCFEQLNDSQKLLIDLRYGNNFSFQQIAAYIESTTGAVQRSLSRVRATLRHCVEKRLVRMCE